jgi:hypothetical protein
MNFLETLWSIIVFSLFLGYLILLFHIIGDIFRDTSLSGWYKALWIFFLLVVPLLTALVYLIARGGGMAERSQAAYSAARRETDDYVRHVAGTQSPIDQIVAAKSLLEQGTITEDEYQQLKAKALG